MGRSFQATPEVLSRLKLISPLRKGADAEEKGTLVAFKDKDGNELGAIIIGKQHGSREEQTAMGGQYVRLAGQDTVYLVDKSFSITDTNPKGWLDKDLIKVKPENIRRISCFAEGDKVLYALERQEKAKELQPVGTLRDKKLNKQRSTGLSERFPF